MLTFCHELNFLFVFHVAYVLKNNVYYTNYFIHIFESNWNRDLKSMY